MKKGFVVILIFFMLSLSVYAGEITYDNVISDTTSIEEDFEILGFDIEDYYEPTQYNYEKWYGGKLLR